MTTLNPNQTLTEGSINDDTFIFTGGHVVYTELGGTDVIEIPEEFILTNIGFSRRISVSEDTGEICDDLYLSINGDNSILLSGHYLASDGSTAFETLRFVNGSREFSISSFRVNTTATEGDDVIRGVLASQGNTDDNIIALGGADRIFSGAGNDRVRGGDGDDHITIGSGLNQLEGQGDNDLFDYEVGNASSFNGNFVLGGEGTDTVNFSNFNTGLRVDLARGFDSFVESIEEPTARDTISTIESIVGSQSNDEIIGGSDDNTFTGGLGDDDLRAGAGNDTYIYALGDGNDTINDAEGTDKILFGSEIVLSQLSFVISGNDLIIDTDGTGVNQLTLQDHFAEGKDIVETIEFDDGSSFDLATIISNQAPVAEEDNFTGLTGENITGNVLADNGNGADSDPEGDVLNVIAGIITTTQGGSVEILANGDFIYTSDAEFSGSDNFEYTLSDNKGGLTVGNVNLNIELPASNNAPIGKDDLLTAEADETITGNVLADNGNGVDSDPDDDELKVTEGTFASVQGGSVEILSNGDFIYTPATGYSGGDSFSYTVSDTNGASSTATVSITLNAENIDPIANSDSFNVDEDTELTGNLLADNGNGPDNDDNGDPLSVQSVVLTSLNGATVTINSTGTFTYIPAENFNGVDSFEYTLLDGRGGSATASASIVVNPVDDNLIANDDDFIVGEDAELTGNVLENDISVEAVAPTVDAGLLTSANGGSVSIQENGDFIYTPAENFSGIDSFDYRIFDENDEDTATVNIEVLSENDDPNAQDDSFVVDEDTELLGDLLADNGSGVDNDVDGDSLRVQSAVLTSLNGATVTINSTGAFTYMPAENFNGADSFEYTLLDDQGGSATATASVTVNPVNDNPIAQDDDFTTSDSSIALRTLAVATTNVLSNDVDVDGDELHIQAETVTSVNGGTVVLNSDGEFEYMAAEGFSGQDSFEYTLLDGQGGSDVGTVNLTVDAVEDPDDRNIIMGTNNNERLAGTNEDDAIYGLNGRDFIFARNGDDFIDGGNGHDILFGGRGDDEILGGAGRDMLLGQGDNDTLRGGDANDRLFGGNGDDILYGDGGNDFLYGGNGNDIFYFGAGVDRAWGGSGVDTFVVGGFDRRDIIEDFQVGNGGDIIDISNVLSGYDETTDDILDFVNLTGARNQFLQVDDGDKFTTVAIVQGGLSGTSINELIDSGNLVVSLDQV